MRKLLAILPVLAVFFGSSQIKKSTSPISTGIARPKLVVGIVVDQMRWDYLYRYYDRYGQGGFKRLLGEGFSCENTLINYLPSYTAVGHSTIFTGSVPALDGISGNNWIDQLSGKNIYCTDDSTVKTIGANDSEDGKMSPRNLLVSTITDELRLATNFQSQVVGVSLKDRASILPAGHLGKAFWLDDNSGNFITSSYYSDKLPDWVNNFNAKKRITQLVANGWSTLYPIDTYKQSTADDVTWEGKSAGETKTSFPHAINEMYAKKKSQFRASPFGNTITLEMATEAVKAYNLGKGAAPDFLTINCASTDYVGHQYGPNSIEAEDTYLRLDKDLSTFFDMLDASVGKGNYLVFLTADHGAAHSIGFMQENKLPADFWYEKPLTDTLNKMLAAKFGTEKLVRSIMNYQVNYDLGKIDAQHLDLDAMKKATVAFLQLQPGISFAVDVAEIGKAAVPEPLKTMITNGYNFKRSGAVQIVLEPGWFEAYAKTGTTHGTWNPYDTHIPLLWYGWGVQHGHSNAEVHMTDISATLAAMLHIQMPNGCVGKVIQEVAK